MVTERIIELGDKKEVVTQEDLPFIVSDVLKSSTLEEHVKLLSYMVSTAYGLNPMAAVKLEINGEIYEQTAVGSGQFDAFMRAVKHIYKEKLSRRFPHLSNYNVSIPRRSHRRTRASHHFMGMGGSRLPHTRSGCRPNGGCNQGYRKDAQPHGK